MNELKKEGRLKEHDVKLSTAVLMMYCLVAAGAFGIEEMIPSSGPGLTIVMLLVLPFIWAAPQALVSAELGGAIPEAGGFYKWVQRGLGEFWGFQACWCRTLSCYIDNALYIVLATGYLKTFIPMTTVQDLIVKFLLIAIFTYINLRGIKEIGLVNSILAIMIFTAFAAVTIVGFANWEFNPMTPFNPPGETMLASLGAGLATGMWMFSGYTAMSNLSGEIKDKTIIPRGLIIVMPIIALSYILPTVAGLASVGQWESWTTDGGIGFGHVLALAGSWGLPIFIIVAALSNLAIYNVQMIAVSRGFFALAEDHLAPQTLVKCSKKYSVPYVSVLSLACFNMLLCTFDFSILVTVDVMLLMVDYILVWIAGCNLRIKEPDMVRPFKLPVGTKGFIAIVTPGITIAVISLFLNGSDYFLGGLIGLISSPAIYIIWKRMYGGMAKIDADKYPINPKTKLAVGDLHRISIIFGILAILGLIASLIFLPWYEGSWGHEYYMDLYNMENAFKFILNGITCLSVGYAIVAISLKIIGNKIDPLK